MLKIQFMSYEAGDNSNDMIITAWFGVLSACFNRLGHLASKSRESYNFIRNEILKLTDKLQKEVGLQPNGYNASNDYCDPLVVKTKGAPSKKNVKKKSRKCSNCNLTGHVASTCPVLLSMDYDFSSSEDTTKLDHAGDESENFTSSDDDTNKEDGSNAPVKNKRMDDDLSISKLKYKKQRVSKPNLKEENIQ
ncbi:uncharacterized protein LOC114916729 [Cajanus cajan]|uniref:uncharacterized protein LOC114916729 n=1 Tax=Cajanus cajan TaxID=3821 RepID=UPI0010FAEA33|nr:uncharacterized protein LOC114916729 [Cajanus cajan]